MTSRDSKSKGLDVNDRLIEIETKLAYQEDLVQSLNDVVAKQSAQIDVLELKLQKLREQTKNDSDGNQYSQDASDELPPHY